MSRSSSSSSIPEFPKELKGVMIAVDLSVKTPVEKLETPMGYKELVSSPKEEKGFPLERRKPTASLSSPPERQIAGGK